MRKRFVNVTRHTKRQSTTQHPQNGIWVAPPTPHFGMKKFLLLIIR